MAVGTDPPVEVLQVPLAFPEEDANEFGLTPAGG